MPPKFIKFVLLIIAIIAIPYGAWFFYVNASYVADVYTCRLENPDCIESEAWTARVNYDSMNSLYYIHELYANGTIKLKDFCLMREAENYESTCKDENGDSWNIDLIELRW